MKRTKLDPQTLQKLDRMRFAVRRILIRDEELDWMRPYDITPPDPEKVNRTWKKFLQKAGWDEEDTDSTPDKTPG